MQEIRWFWALALTIAAEVLLIVCAVLWVFIYSTFINPGQPLATYEAHAQIASPYVAVIVSFPLFFVLAWWLARKANAATVWAFFVIWFLIDLAFVLSVGGWQALLETWLFSLAALVAKAAGVYFGMKRVLT